MNRARMQVEECRIGGDMTLENLILTLQMQKVGVSAIVYSEYGNATIGFSSVLRIKKAILERGQGYYVVIRNDDMELVIGRKCKRVVPFRQAGVDAFFLDFDDIFVTVTENEKYFLETT